jgi:hypothetical protein
MAPTKKTNPAAFDDILAGLGSGAPERASPGRASGGRASLDRVSGDRASKPAVGIDVSWIETAQTRARAKQTVDRVRRNFADAPGADDAPVSPSADAASNSKPSAQNAGAAPIEAAPGPNPVHALRRLLGQLPWGWWRVEALKARKRQKAAAAAEAAPSAQPKAAGPPKNEDEAIARELGLGADLAVVELRRIRREFAKKNHPDRIEPALRVNAARRMTIANMLIDAQVRQKSPK